MAILQNLSSFPSSRLPLYLGAAAAASVGAWAVIRALPNNTEPKKKEMIFPSPLTTFLPRLSEEEQRDLPYPPDLFPGARDVSTPYGNIRLYEWGPEDGRKVLFIHGLSTPCMSCGLLAMRLVEQGCRVMIFDLFGRGYSSNPRDLPHSIQLYSSQILSCITSSPLPWTGSKSRFSVVGYSLGGGIASSFTAYYPHLVSSLVLIAPSGLLRMNNVTWKSRLLYSNWLPENFRHNIIKQRLYVVSPKDVQEQSHREQGHFTPRDVSDPMTAVAAEAGTVTPSTPSAADPESVYSDYDYKALFPIHRPKVTVADTVNWQLDHNVGFVPAFVSAMKNAPISNQHPLYALIGQRLSAQNQRRRKRAIDRSFADSVNGVVPSTPASHYQDNYYYDSTLHAPGETEDLDAARGEMENGKVLLILGALDPVVPREEVEHDVLATLGGPGNCESVVINAGHELPMSKPDECVRVIARFWNMGTVAGAGNEDTNVGGVNSSDFVSELGGNSVGGYSRKAWAEAVQRLVDGLNAKSGIGAAAAGQGAAGASAGVGEVEDSWLNGINGGLVDMDGAYFEKKLMKVRFSDTGGLTGVV